MMSHAHTRQQISESKRELFRFPDVSFSNREYACL